MYRTVHTRKRCANCNAGHNQIIATLALVKTTLCPRLHADYVTVSPLRSGLLGKNRDDPAASRPPLFTCPQVRALCTYFGQGTEFAANKDVQRRLLQRLLFSNTDGYGLKPSGSLQQASAGDVLFLKGHAYPGNSGTPNAPFLPIARV